MIKLRHIFLALALCLIFVYAAQAADKTVAWDAVPAAASYRIDISTDVGENWTLGVATVAAPTTEATVTVPDGVLVLMRAVAINAAGQEAVNYSAGVYYNSAWELPPAVVGLGVSE